MSRLLSVLSLMMILILSQSGLAPTEALSVPTGACCYPDGTCADDMYQAECEGQGGTYQGDETTCAEVECGAAIPTLTEWGLIIFGLVLIGFITWVFLRRRRKAVASLR